MTLNNLIIVNLKESLRNIRKTKMHGILIRSRAQLIEDDEKPSKYFCNLESHNYVNKIIPKIEKEDGTFIKDQDQILNEAKLLLRNFIF